jgi:hypothetical protein
MYCSPLPGGDIGVGGGGFKAGSLDLVDFKDSPVPDPYPDPDPSVGVARPSTGEVRSSSSQESITSSFFVFDFIFDADGRSMCRFDIFDSISTAGIGSAPQTMTGLDKAARDPGDDSQERRNCTTSRCKKTRPGSWGVTGDRKLGGTLYRCHRLGKSVASSIRD